MAVADLVQEVAGFQPGRDDLGIWRQNTENSRERGESGGGESVWAMDFEDASEQFGSDNGAAPEAPATPAEEEAPPRGVKAQIRAAQKEAEAKGHELFLLRKVIKE